MFRTTPSTKADPYSIHFLYRRLMDIDGLSFRKTVTVPATALLKRRPGLTGAILISKYFREPITKITADTVTTLTTDIPRTKEALSAYQIEYDTPRKLEDFPSFEKVKKYGKKFKDWEGGAYTLVDLYHFNGEWFANFECSHTMYHIYSVQNNLV